MQATRISRRSLTAALVAIALFGLQPATGADETSPMDRSGGEYLAAFARDYGPRVLLTGSLFAWGLLAPDQLGTGTIEIPPGDPVELNEAIDRAGTVAAVLAMGTSTAGRVVSDWPNAMDEISRSAAVIASAYATRSYLKAVFRRTRPSAAADGPVTVDDAQSFPSGHTLLAFACVGDALVGAMRRQVEPWVLASVTIEAIAVAALRVGAGAHYPGDVVAGAAIGLAVGSVVSLLILPRG